MGDDRSDRGEPRALKAEPKGDDARGETRGVVARGVPGAPFEASDTPASDAPAQTLRRTPAR